MQNLQEQRDIYIAACQGKEIQFKPYNEPLATWQPIVICNKTWLNFGKYKHRVKPEPKYYWLNNITYTYYESLEIALNYARKDSLIKVVVCD